MSDFSDSCLYTAHERSALKEGTLSLSVKKRSRIAVHLQGCEDCQIYFMMHLWEAQHEHAMPQPPHVVERWRSIATYILSPEPHPHAQAELEQLEIQARLQYRLDGEWHTRLTRWLEEIEEFSRKIGGLDSYDPSAIGD